MYITNFRYNIKLCSYKLFLQLISCLLRGTLQTNQPELVAAPAGFLAGLSSMSLFRSTSITIYTAWKTIDVSLFIKIKTVIANEFYFSLMIQILNISNQILLKTGVASGRLPAVPFCTELAYASATAVLFHFGVTEPESLKPSYFGFLNRITENR